MEKVAAPMEEEVAARMYSVAPSLGADRRADLVPVLELTAVRISSWSFRRGRSADPPPERAAAPAQVRRFADPDADTMARGSVACVFLAAVETHASVVAALRAELACGCVPPSSPREKGGVSFGVVAEVVKRAPAEFLADRIGEGWESAGVRRRAATRA